MRPSAVKKATRRLRQAKDAVPSLSQLQKGVQTDDFERDWFSFLGTLNSIPEILKTGTRDDPTSRQWWAAKDRLVRKDPLLRYLFHARAVDFHGDDRLLKLRTTAGDPEEVHYALADPVPLKAGLNLFIPADVQSITIWHEPQPVKDLNGNVFHPPSSHLGADLHDVSPAGLAKTSIAFYEALILEAEARLL